MKEHSEGYRRISKQEKARMSSETWNRQMRRHDWSCLEEVINLKE